MDEKKLNELENAKETNVSEAEPAKKNKKGSWAKRNVPWLVIETLVLVISLVFLYYVVQTTNRVEKVEVDKSNVVINEEVIAQKEVQKKEKYSGKGIRNIALFGVDSRAGELGSKTRSDTMIIASIDQDNHTIKLISLYRDTYLNVGNDVYTKCNAAYAKGGPEQAISMLNMNLDLDITDYVTVGFEGLTEVIDALGGIEIEVTDSEISHINNYQLCMAETMGTDYTSVIEGGLQNLNGLQATAYCRVRYTSGDDYKRAERQRLVINRILLKAQTVSISKLSAAALAVMPNIATSLSVEEILSLLTSVGDYQVVTSTGFPFEDHFIPWTLGANGACIVPRDLKTNVSILHEVLYGSGDGYQVSSKVQEISAKIDADATPYINGTAGQSVEEDSSGSADEFVDETQLLDGLGGDSSAEGDAATVQEQTAEGEQSLAETEGTTD